MRFWCKISLDTNGVNFEILSGERIRFFVYGDRLRLFDTRQKPEGGCLMKRCGGFNRRNHSPDHGFTLIELLAVIAIIGLLASLALPAISRIRERSKIGATKAQLAQIETALSQYYAEWDTYPPMGNDWLGGGFFPSEDVGSDQQGPFVLSGGQWIVNATYPGPDTDGTEGNYRLDPGEDGVALGDYLFPKNNKLDGTYYDRLGMFADTSKPGLMDIFEKDTYYHYYGGYVTGTTTYGMPIFNSYASLSDYMTNHPMYYNRWVLYSVGIDGKDHGLHNYYLTMQNGEDVGTDAYSSDPADQDGDHILFEPSTQTTQEENNDVNDPLSSSPITIRETRWTVNLNGRFEGDLQPGGDPNALDVADGKPVFSYDVRQERRRRGQVFATPDGDAQAYGVIMRYGP
jgi:prepilin-type N-terminal cleavage/methylation domain-containing protein